MTLTMLERLENVKKLWALLVPSCQAPDDYNLARWVSRFTDSEIEYAINRTAIRFRNGAPSDPMMVPRYATGILLNEQKAKSAKVVA
jgi:hypothetical protein